MNEIQAEPAGLTRRMALIAASGFFIVGLVVSGAITANWYKAKSANDKQRIAALEQVIRTSIEFNQRQALNLAPGRSSAENDKPQIAAAAPSTAGQSHPPQLPAAGSEQVLTVASAMPPKPTTTLPSEEKDVVASPANASRAIARAPVEPVKAAVNNTPRIEAKLAPAAKPTTKTAQTTVAISTRPDAMPAPSRSATARDTTGISPRPVAAAVPAKILPAPQGKQYQAEEYVSSSRAIARVVAAPPDSNQEATIVGAVTPSARPEAIQARPGPAYKINDSAVINVAEVEKNNKVEGVSASRVGVKELTEEAVVVRNGDRIKVGDRFPSGERLLRVDPGASKIVTDQRTILLL